MCVLCRFVLAGCCIPAFSSHLIEIVGTAATLAACRRACANVICVCSLRSKSPLIRACLFFWFFFRIILEIFYLNVFFWALENKMLHPKNAVPLLRKKKHKSNCSFGRISLEESETCVCLFIRSAANTDYVRRYCLFFPIVCV